MRHIRKKKDIYFIYVYRCVFGPMLHNWTIDGTCVEVFRFWNRIRSQNLMVWMEVVNTGTAKEEEEEEEGCRIGPNGAPITKVVRFSGLAK